MIIAIGRIEDKDSLIGIRIYDTDKKSVKDIRIEDTDKIKIKNRSKIYRLGVVDNKKEPKQVILLGYKDRKAMVIDINGRTSILEDTSKYETVTIKSNIEEYEKYISKLRLLGEEVFNYEVKEDTDEVLITEYISNNEKERIIEIPSFVTGIKLKKNADGYNIYLFEGVTQSLKIIHKYNQIKDMESLFRGFRGEKLDIRNFDTSKVTNMSLMFNWCEKLQNLDISNFDTSKVEDMDAMFSCCYKLKELDIRNFDTSNVKNMHFMFNECYSLNELDLSNFDTSNVKNMSLMFCGCRELKELDISNFDTSKVKDMRCMFEECKNLKELDLSNFDTSNVENMEYMFYGTSLTKENTGLRFKRNIKNFFNKRRWLI